jgi:hypothetical protein
VARSRTTKKLAQRIDLNYFKRSTPLKRAKLYLSLLAPLLAITWIGWHITHQDQRVYSSGRLSEPHAVLERQCSSCHLQKTAVFSAKADKQACLACHDGPIHHPTQVSTPDCATCHTEHRGRVNLSAVSEKSCASCHADLQSFGISHYSAHIRNFGSGHPEFAVLRENRRDPSTVKLNHSIHMKPIRLGPTGVMVQLQCTDCHRPAAAKLSWTYADANYSGFAPTAANHQAENSQDSKGLSPYSPPTGRELMAPVTFANSCAACHLLTFDKRFNEGVPHDTPEVIHAFLIKKFQEYAAAHPSELRSPRDPDRDLTGTPLTPRIQTLTAAQWVAIRNADAEQLLWRKTCLQCHQLSFSGTTPLPRVQARAGGGSLNINSTLPQIANAAVTTRWMPHAKFDHDAHRAFTCVGCHQKALNSMDSRDVLLPGIATCQTCHASGPAHAESRCFECHTYHDWAQRKEITPSFNFSPTQTGGR